MKEKEKKKYLLEEVKRKEARNREEVLEKRKKLGRKSP
jgi:hypothetical protein